MIHANKQTYRNWRVRQLLQLVGLIGVSLLVSLVPQASAATGSTQLTELLLPGPLALTSSPTALLSNITLNGSNSQSSTGSLGLTTVSDGRGTSAGWSLTATATAFSSIGTPQQIVGSAGSLLTGGNYTGTAPGTYTVTIGTPGILGVAAYTVSGLETQTLGLTGTGVALGTHGLTLSFGVGSYTTGEQWTIVVTTIPASNLTITPSVTSVLTGSASGVSSGNAYTYTTGNDPAPLMTATAGNGAGTYTNTPALSLAIPSGTKAGAYVATLTETVN